MSKIVLITGASGGIGRELCREFSHVGYKVVATDLTRLPGIRCDAFIKCDLDEICRSDTALNSFVDSVQCIIGADCLNVLVNNAAIQKLDRTKDIDKGDWIQTMNINLMAPFLLVQSFLKDLEVSGGSVVNISSVHSRATKFGFVSYATSKAALDGLTRSLAVDLGGKVRINAVNPAATETAMLLAGFDGKLDSYKDLESAHPIGRIAEPNEVARVVVFLASDDASFITGNCLSVDGGVLSRLHDPE